jgi:RNA polymerase sigma-70 factor (ECF subfamily)
VTASDAEAEARIDAALIARAVQLDDRAAFGQLMLRHMGLVRAQLRRLTGGDHAWADDIAQEAFLQAWRKLDQFRGGARFTTWLFQVSYATFLQAARRRKSQARLQREGAQAQEADDRCDDAELSSLRLDLTGALLQLPEAQRAALVHCYHLDLSHEEAAEVLGIPVGTVKSLVTRGKSKLKQLLSAWHQEHRRDDLKSSAPMSCGDDEDDRR